MKYRFWVYDLNTDRGDYADSAPELLSHIEDPLQSGITVQDVGIILEETLEETNAGN